MYQKLATVLLAFCLLFSISDQQNAGAHHIKRGFGKVSYVNMTKKQRAKKTVRKQNSRKARQMQGNAVRISVSLGQQRMIVTQGGKQIANWRISSGRKGFRTPQGRYRVGRMYKSYFSRKYDNAPMPHAMFFRGGFAIHGTYHTGALGRPASHGCIRLAPGNAAKLFGLVRRHGGIVEIGG